MNEIVSLLIRWYDAVRKPLPWRESPTPYHVWISEIMLQQTRIEAVLPYYRRFLDELPDVRSLAEAEEERLMKLWEGLGYYRRARNLKKAAELLVAEYGGELPHTAEELRKLPGIGDYTAGAIASIAFGEPEPAVDGNVLRVYSRLFASADDIALEKTKKAVRERLRESYPRGREAGLLTEGLMELGETVCLPNGEPHCMACPLRERCRAFRQGAVGEYPVKSEKKARRVEDRTVFLLRDGESYAIRKRAAGGLLGGMWEFPNLDGHLTEAEAVSAAEKLGFHADGLRPLGKARHIFSHVEWHMIGYELTGRASASNDLIWASAAAIRTHYAVPAAFRFYTGEMEASRGETF
ncbi:MAG: A/G-specific adenine glycosylase [Eubacteriales bacterium]